MGDLKLRALTTADIEKTLGWHNREDIQDLYTGHPFPVNIETERKWYEKILTSNFPTSVFGLEHREAGKLLGISVLRDINLIHRQAEFAIYIGDEAERGKGYALEGTRLTLAFGFFKLGLNRVFLKVLKENERAIHIYKKLGFVEEGLLRECVFKNNAFRDQYVMAILKSEFENINS